MKKNIFHSRTKCEYVQRQICIVEEKKSMNTKKKTMNDTKNCLVLMYAAIIARFETVRRKKCVIFSRSSNAVGPTVLALNITD